MYSQHSSRSQFGMPPPSSRRSSATGDVPLTAERAMMDQIRSKLERAQRRLARNAPSSSSSSVASRYIPSSEYNSAMHRPPVKSVLVEDMPATTSKTYSSMAPPPSTIRPPPPTRQGVPPPSSRRHERYPQQSSSTRTKYHPQQQYKSRSKYSQSNAEADPLNGGPPPMSTPYLVYSSSRPPTTGSSHHSKSTRPPISKGAPPPTEQRHRDPTNTLMNGPPSAMRSGLPKPPSSRVRFQGHEAEIRESMEKERDSEMERKRRHQQMKEKEARHQRHRQKELESVNVRAKGSGPSSPIAAGNRGRRSSSMEKPPGSAIDVAAFEEMGPRGRRSNSVEKPPSSAIANPKSPVGHPRRSSVNNPPPKSDIKVSAFDDIIPRRRSAAQDDEPVPVQPEETVDESKLVKENVGDLKLASGEKDVEQEQSPEVDNQKEQLSPPPSVIRELYASSTSSEDGGDTSSFESDDSELREFSDFDVDSDYDYLSSGYSDYASTAQSEMMIESPKAEPGSKNDLSLSDESSQALEAEDSLESPPASELSPVEEEPQSRLTARDLAFLALGRVSSCSLSDISSVTSANGKESPRYKPAPTSYAPASSAFPPSRYLTRTPASAGRPRDARVPPPAPQTSGANYIRRSRARAPMDLKNQLPPSIGVLSGLSSGSSKFVVDPSSFYEVVWKTGEFAFSVQRVYTEENEFEFDDRNEEPQLFLRMLLNTERSTCRSFHNVRVGDVLVRVGDAYVSELGLEGSGSVLTKFFAKLTAQTPIKLTFQRMYFSEWEGGVEL